MFSEDINQSIYLVDVFLKVSACLLMSSLRNLFISSSILFISESNLGNEKAMYQIKSEFNFCKLSPFTDVIKFRIHHGEISHFHRNSAVLIHFILSLSLKSNKIDLECHVIKLIKRKFSNREMIKNETDL